MESKTYRVGGRRKRYTLPVASKVAADIFDRTGIVVAVEECKPRLPPASPDNTDAERALRATIRTLWSAVRQLESGVIPLQVAQQVRVVAEHYDPQQTLR